MKCLSKYLFLFLAFVSVVAMQAQSAEYVLIHKGNKLYYKRDFKQAEIFYRRALSANPRSARAFFNMGNVLFMQKKPDDAMKQYEKAAQLETNPKIRARVFHNVGVIYQSNNYFSEAAEAYKKSLRNDPNNDDTRYNLALCQHQIKKGGGGKKPKSQQQKQQQQQPKQQPKNKPQPQSAQPQPSGQMSKQNAESLLNIVEREEKNTQDKLKKNMKSPQSKRLEKNW